MSRDRLAVGIHDTLDPARLVPAERDLVTGRVATGPRRGDKDRPDSRDARHGRTRHLMPVALAVAALVIVASAATALGLRAAGEPSAPGAPAAGGTTGAPPTSEPVAGQQSASTTPSVGPSTPLGPQAREYRVLSYTLTTGAVSGSPGSTETEWDRGTLSMTCVEGRCGPVYMPQFPPEPVSVPDAPGTHPYTAPFEPLTTDGCPPLSRGATGTVTFAGTRMETTGSIPRSRITCGGGTIEYSSQTWTVVGELVG